MESLITALEKQLELLNKLHCLLKRETKELADIQLDSMAEINGQKENVTAQIEANSEVLRKELTAAALREGLSAKVTLGELADMYKQKGKKQASQLHEEINMIAEQIRNLISINREIAERFAASVTNSLDLLTRVINQSNTYGASGAYQQKPAGAVLINREA